VSQRYAIRLAGRLDAESRDAFAGMQMRFEEGMTILVGEGDQAALHGWLELIRCLGLELVDVRKVRGGRLSSKSGDAQTPGGS
jgi:hypothetical protein